MRASHQTSRSIEDILSDTGESFNKPSTGGPDSGHSVSGVFNGARATDGDSSTAYSAASQDEERASKASFARILPDTVIPGNCGSGWGEFGRGWR